MIRRSAAWLMLAILGAGLARADEAPSVLILPFESASARASQAQAGSGAAELVAAFLEPQADHVKPVDRDQLDAVMAEHALRWENVMQDKSTDLGRLVQARYILRGSVLLDHRGWLVHGFLYETDTARLVQSFQASARKGEIDHACETLAAEVARFFSAPVKPLPAFPVEKDPETNLRMIEGLGGYYNGRYEQALPAFLKILRDHPDHADAMYWLTKTMAAGGLMEQATLEAERFAARFPKDARVRELKELVKSAPST